MMGDFVSLPCTFMRSARSVTEGAAAATGAAAAGVALVGLADLGLNDAAPPWLLTLGGWANGDSEGYHQAKGYDEA